MTSASTIVAVIETLEIQKTIQIAAPIEIAFEAMLEDIGPDVQMMDGTAMPTKLEAWPGGRWYRDLGDNTGRLWGHVQVIKHPTLLELCGPLMMSYPAMNHVQYRFTAEGQITRLSFTHRGMGQFLPQHRDGVDQDWSYWLEKIRSRAEGLRLRRESVSAGQISRQVLPMFRPCQNQSISRHHLKCTSSRLGIGEPNWD